MNWTHLRKNLQNQETTRLVKIIKGLYDLTPQNKAYLRNQFAETPDDSIFLEECRKDVINAIYPPGKEWPDYPSFARARQAVNAYKKATGDVYGVIDLLITYAETGTQFTVDFGDIDENFYIRLETALNNAAETLKSSPTRIALYAQFCPRFLKLQKDVGWMGWGYGDTVNDIVAELEALFE